MKTLNPTHLIDAALFAPPSLRYPSAWVGHFPFAAWLVRDVAPGVFVELGVHGGGSYFAFCQSILEAGLQTKCYAIDTWIGDKHSGEYGEDVFEYVNYHNANHFAAFSTFLRMTFEDAAKDFADGSVDLLHIDGLHTYEAVRRDFETWLPKLTPGALVLLHDTQVRQSGFGVWRLWQELCERYPRSLELTHSYGLGVLQLDNAPEDRRREWLYLGPEDRKRFADYFAVLGGCQLERCDLGGQVIELSRSLADQERQKAELHQLLAERESQVGAIFQSTSWRITEPLRQLGGWLKRRGLGI